MSFNTAPELIGNLYSVKWSLLLDIKECNIGEVYVF